MVTVTTTATTATGAGSPSAIADDDDHHAAARILSSDLHASSSSSLSSTMSSSSSSSPSTSPQLSSSSAGPLKKRRKMDQHHQQQRRQQQHHHCDETSQPVASFSDTNATNTNTHHNELHPVADNRNSENYTHCSQETPHQPRNHPSIHAHFPSILHRLLTTVDIHDNDDDRFVSSAIEWLPHGRGWRVLRWDVLRNKVLPRLFPTACSTKKSRHKITGDDRNDVNHNNYGNDDDYIVAGYQDMDHRPLISSDDDIGGKRIVVSTSSVDHGSYEDDDERQEWLVEVFLWHVRAFGFEEVTSGLDRGSYCHELFARDDPVLCDSMRILNLHPIPTSSSVPTTTFATKAPDPLLLLSETPMTSSPMATWRQSQKMMVSSIFKPRRIGRNITDSSSSVYHQQHQQQHTPNQHPYHHSNHPQYHYHHPPPYLSVPMLSSGGSTIASSSFAEPYYCWNDDHVRGNQHIFTQQQQQHHPHQQQRHQQNSWHSTSSTSPYHYCNPPPPPPPTTTTLTTTATAQPPPSSSSTSSLSHKTIRFMDEEPTPMRMVESTSFSRTMSETNMTTTTNEASVQGAEILSPEFRARGNAWHKGGESMSCHYPHREAYSNNSNRSGFVSRRGRRPALIARTASH